MTPTPVAEPLPYTGRRVAAFVALVLAEYGRTCHLCGKDGADSADHLVPRSRGGAVWDVANGRPAHKLCNIRRGAMPIEQWRELHPIAAPKLSPSRPW